MSDVEDLKTEIATLKNQLSQNSQGAQNLMCQIDALKGELADSRTISLQLRMNLITAQNTAIHFQDQCKILQNKLDECKSSKTAEIPALKEVAKGK